MPTPPWFSDLAVVAELPGDDAVAALRTLGEEHAADKLEMALLDVSSRPSDKFSLPPGVLDDRAFMHRGRVVGHLEPVPSPIGLRPLREIDDLTPDTALAGQRINVAAIDYTSAQRLPDRTATCMTRVVRHLPGSSPARFQIETAAGETTHSVVVPPPMATPSRPTAS